MKFKKGVYPHAEADSIGPSRYVLHPADVSNLFLRYNRPTVTDGVWTVRRLLEWTTPFFTRKDVDTPRLSAELLLSHVLSIPRIKLYTDYERVLSEADLAQYRDLVRRAAEQEPVAYLTGRVHFFNLEFELTRDVLIPRPDTETLVENAIRIARAQATWTHPRVLDLCTGSGCVAAAVAANLRTARVVATEISPAAASVARRNFQRLGLEDRVTGLEGDLFAALDSFHEQKEFHLILANPPYIPSEQISQLDRSVRDYEPHLALDGGPDGLNFHRRIWEQAPTMLGGEGQVLLEIAFDQGPAALAAVADYPLFAEPRILKDYGGRDRVVAAEVKKGLRA
jgi:release factor glutamine methyltransferase